MKDVVVLYEHPEWQKPLFAALEKKRVSFEAFDLKKGAFVAGDVPQAKVVFNQASPSAYVRGNTRAVPFALSFLKSLEGSGATIINGARAFAFELSKTAQAAVIASLSPCSPST